MKLIAGIDPGLSGAIVILGGVGEPLRFPMPVVEVKQKGKKTPKREYNIPAIIGVLTDEARLDHFAQSFGAKVLHVYIEKQQAMSQPVPHRCGVCSSIVGLTTPQGSVSIFSHARGYGLLEGIVAGLGLPYTLVHPKTWQTALLAGSTGDSKARAQLVCGRLFPGLDLRASTRARNPHEGIVDGLLIGVYGQRALGGDFGEYDETLGF